MSKSARHTPQTRTGGEAPQEPSPYTGNALRMALAWFLIPVVVLIVLYRLT